MRKLADLFKALSDETRVTLLALLMKHGELCVCDLVETLGITQSKASRHLRYLAHAGLVRDRRVAVWVHYRIEPEPAPEPAAVLQAIRPLLFARDLATLDARLQAWARAKALAGSGCRADAAAPGEGPA